MNPFDNAPYSSYIPSQVLYDDSISDSVKVYYGQLRSLANKFGYVFASDLYLSEMKRIPIRTIQYWNMKLEKAGHIRREIKMVCDRNAKGVTFWKKTRKIYIDENFQKNIAEPQRIAPSIEPATNCGYNDKSIKENKQHAKPHKEQAKKEKKPVLLKKEDIAPIGAAAAQATQEEKELHLLKGSTASFVKRIMKYSIEEIRKALEITSMRNPANPCGFLTSYIQDPWPFESQAERQNEEVNAFIKKIKATESKKYPSEISGDYFVYYFYRLDKKDAQQRHVPLKDIACNENIRDVIVLDVEQLKRLC